MKAIAFFFCTLFSVSVFANNIIVNGTRFIYPGNEKEITVQLNNSADRPAIAQAWLDNGNPNETPDTIKTPFQVTPPISKLEAKGGQALRIKLMSKSELPTDRESLLWLNILDIPPTVKNANKSDENTLQLAIRSRFKFFYRPTGLGSRDSATKQLVLSAKGNQLTINNPSPFYITIIKVSIDGKTALNQKAIVLAPKSTEVVELKRAVKSGEIIVLNNINDYGSDIVVKATVK